MSDPDLQARYARLAALCLRFGDWLLSDRARLLPLETFEGLYARYQEHLAEFRRVGDLLRVRKARPGARRAGA